MENKTDSPYQPPSAHVYDQLAYKKPAPVKAVVVGLLVDQVGTAIFQLAFFIAYGFLLAETGVTPQQVEHMVVSLGWDSWPRLATDVGGLFVSMLAGYLCARIARERIFRTTLIMAFLDVAAPLPFLHERAVPELLGLVLTPLCVFLGAWLWVAAVRRER